MKVFVLYTHFYFKRNSNHVIKKYFEHFLYFFGGVINPLCVAIANIIHLTNGS